MITTMQHFLLWPRVVRCTTAKRHVLFFLALFLSACDTTPPAPLPLDPQLTAVVPMRQFTADQAMTMEFELLTSPSDIQSRVDLLWHYRSQFGDARAERDANKHVLWFIEHQPRAAVLATPIAEIPALPDRTAFNEASALWDKQVADRGKDAIILGNAGVFYASADPSKAVPLLEKAVAWDQESPIWIVHLAKAYHALALASPKDPEHRLARRSVQAFEQAIAKAKSPREQANLMIHLSAVAMDALDLPKAQRAANDLINISAQLTDASDKAVALHAANIALGRVELIEGRDNAALQHLSEAKAAIKGQDVFYSQLDMSLARSLLNKGHKLPVLQYLDVVHQITKSSEVGNWLGEIKASMLPDVKGFSTGSSQP